MRNYNPFRVSFDRPLSTRERRRARVAALAVGGAALLLGASAALALLNASSDTIAALSNGTLEPQPRMVARVGQDAAGKPCEQQTWPYIEQRCLKRADESAERSTPKHGLGADRVMPQGAKVPRGNGSEAGPAEDSGTTGLAPPVENAEQDRTGFADTQLRSRAIGTDASRKAAEPPLSRRDQRRLEREHRVRLQSERRKEMRRLRAERLRARAEARRARRDRREMATPRGPFGTGLFGAIR